MKCSSIFVVAVLLVVVEVVAGDHEDKIKMIKEHIKDVCSNAEKSAECEQCMETFFKEKHEEWKKNGGALPSPDTLYEKCKEDAKMLSDKCGADQAKSEAKCDELKKKWEGKR